MRYSLFALYFYIKIYVVKQEIKDLLTGDLFIPKRSNQLYVNRTNQIRMNNLRAKTKRTIKAVIDKPLDVNRTVLLKMLEDRQEIIRSEQFLLGAGFNFNFYTHSSVLDKEKDIILYFVYEISIMPLENKQYKIYRNERHN